MRVPRTVVLVPAHNEENCLRGALESIKADLAGGDRVLVVAHNCTDGTAGVAGDFDVEVLEVSDSGTGGKPDALKAGLAHLDAAPPEVVVIIDADCRVAPGAIRSLAVAAAATRGPVQGDYRFAAGEEDDFGSLSSLALLVKNFVRPLGLTRLGLPCLLNGAGSAYPFSQLRSAPHGEGSIAEDYQLAIDLAKRGHPTRFLPEARVRSVLPDQRGAAMGQRRRWEHGHLSLVLRAAPALVVRGLLTLDVSLFFMGVDLLVPPLAFLALGWSFGLVLAVGALVLTGESMALWTTAVSGALMGVGLSSALLRFAGSRALLQTLRSAPGYVLTKLPLYLGFMKSRETRWQKTERTSSPATPKSDEADEAKDERPRTGT